MTVSQICDVVILVSAVLIAVKNIYEFFAKPTSKIKTRYQKHLDSNIGTMIEEKMETALKKHDEAVAADVECRKEQVKNAVKEEILLEIKPTLDSILEQNQQQNISIDKLNISSKDMLRQRIMSIYYLNRKARQLTDTELEILNELYKDYKAQGGNSYIDKYYRRMKTWKVLEDDYED